MHAPLGRRPMHLALGILAMLAAHGNVLAQEEGSEPAATGDAAGNLNTAASTDIEGPQPYYLRISQGFAHDSNVFRVGDGLPRASDWISSTALLAGFDQPFGRQRGFGSATLRGNAYRSQSQLNNLGYDLALGLDWATVERLSGDLRLNLAQSLAQFSNYGSVPREATGKNQELSQSVGGRVQYGITADWALEALLRYSNLSYTADAFDNRERRDYTYGGGVRYRPNAIWSFGVGGRRTNGEFPRASVKNGEFVADNYTRDSLDFSARLNATGLSTFESRLSYTRETHELDTSRDFRGWTGLLAWNYQATGKVNLGLNLARDTGTNSTSTNAAGVQTYLSDARLTNSIGANVGWKATSKISVNASLDYWRETFDDQFTQIVQGNQTVSASGETTNSYRYRLSATYQPTRTLSLECGARRESRDARNSIFSTIYGFSSTLYYCNGVLALRG